MKKIKSITLYKCDFISGKVQKDQTVKPFKFNFIEYNLNGDLIKEIHFSKNEEEESLSEYLINSAGFLTEQKHFEEGELAERIAFTQNSHGGIDKEYRYYLDDTFDTIQYTYTKNHLTEKTYYNSESEVERSEYFEWKENKMTREWIQDEEGQIIFDKSYTYQEDNGLIIEELLKDMYEGKETKTLYEYNEKGNKALIRSYNNQHQLISRLTYLYNESGKLVQLIEEEGHKKNKLFFEYDENGNLIKQEEYNAHEILISKFEQVFNPENLIISYSAFIDKLGEGTNQNYSLTYNYEYFD